MTDTEKKIEAEAYEIAHCIRRLAMLDQDSRGKVLATVKAYYELGSDTLPGGLKKLFDATVPIMQASIPTSLEDEEAPGQNTEINLEGGVPVDTALNALYGPVLDEEEQDLRILVFNFSQDMYAKLREKYREDGFEGWDDSRNPRIEELLVEGMTEHLKNWECKGVSNLIDIANYCAFIWHHRRKQG